MGDGAGDSHTDDSGSTGLERSDSASLPFRSGTTPMNGMVADPPLQGCMDNSVHGEGNSPGGRGTKMDGRGAYQGKGKGAAGRTKDMVGMASMSNGYLQHDGAVLGAVPAVGPMGSMGIGQGADSMPLQQDSMQQAHLFQGAASVPGLDSPKGMAKPQLGQYTAIPTTIPLTHGLPYQHNFYPSTQVAKCFVHVWLVSAPARAMSVLVFCVLCACVSR